MNVPSLHRATALAGGAATAVAAAGRIESGGTPGLLTGRTGAGVGA